MYKSKKSKANNRQKGQDKNTYNSEAKKLEKEKLEEMSLESLKSVVGGLGDDVLWWDEGEDWP